MPSFIQYIQNYCESCLNCCLKRKMEPEPRHKSSAPAPAKKSRFRLLKMYLLSMWCAQTDNFLGIRNNTLLFLVGVCMVRAIERIFVRCKLYYRFKPHWQTGKTCYLNWKETLRCAGQRGVGTIALLEASVVLNGHVQYSMYCMVNYGYDVFIFRTCFNMS